MIDKLFNQFCNGLDQERAWTAREEGPYGKMFQEFINSMNNFQLLEYIDLANM